MEVFRLSKEKFARSLSGVGAALKGARWNSTGFELIYTAANRSLAMAEVAVHFSGASAPDDYMMTVIQIPDQTSIQVVDLAQLPVDWSAFPHPASTKSIGDAFILEKKYCLLKVPSAVTQGDFNYLINPRHPECADIKILRIEPFRFDSRLIN
jgi:RES domain-containing protein